MRPSGRYQYRCLCGLIRFLFNFRFALFDINCKHCMLSVFTQCFEKNVRFYSGGTRTHDLLPSSADVLTTRPPNLPVSAGWFE